jgi:ribosomal protein L19E
MISHILKCGKRDKIIIDKNIESELRACYSENNIKLQKEFNLDIPKSWTQ